MDYALYYNRLLQRGVYLIIESIRFKSNWIVSELTAIKAFAGENGEGGGGGELEKAMEFPCWNATQQIIHKSIGWRIPCRAEELKYEGIIYSFYLSRA